VRREPARAAAPHGVVAAVWVILAAGYGLFFSFSIFFVALIEEFGWSRALTAGAFSISTVVQGLLAPFVGVVVDRLRPRRIIAAGIVVLASSLLLAATIRAPWQLYLYTGVLGALGMTGLGWVPMGVLLSRWIAERRGRMMGLAFSGMGVGVFAVGPLAQWLIATIGWRRASSVLGVGLVAVLLPIALAGTRDPRPAPPPAPAAPPPPGDRAPRPSDPTLGDALTSRSFWALFAAYLLTPLAVFPVFTHQVAFAVDLGFPRLFVASVFGMMGLMSSVGRAVFGVLSDRLGGPTAATLSYACTAGGSLALVGLEQWPHAGWLYAYALLFGLGFGARGPIITAMATELFAGGRFGAIYGLLNLANGVGAALGPWFGGAVHDVFGSYRLAFVSSVVFSAAGAACFLGVRRRAP
jgi:MFS family permease